MTISTGSRMGGFYSLAILYVRQTPSDVAAVDAVGMTLSAHDPLEQNHGHSLQERYL